MRAYTTGPDYKNGYARKLPLFNKCKLHQTDPCTVKYDNCKRVGHMTRNMEWLTKYHAVIICYEKLVRIPFSNEALTIRGDMSEDRRDSRLNIIAHTKTHKYIQKGCHVFLAHITEKKTEEESEEKRLGSKKEHEEHLKLILELLKKEELYAKLSKCELWLPKVQFLGDIIDSQEGMENFIVYCDASHKGLGANAEREGTTGMAQSVPCSPITKACNTSLIRRS
ncbi:hypothetical protein Tco_1407992 [Tanacetum coccineum]